MYVWLLVSPLEVGGGRLFAECSMQCVLPAFVE